MCSTLTFNSKYKTIEGILEDRGYCKWLCLQSWFQKRSEYKRVEESLVYSGYESIEEIIKDRKHCKWLCEQSWFKNHEWYTLCMSDFDSIKVKQYFCSHEWRNGKIVEIFDSCNRMWCTSNKSCCFKSGYEYTCDKCRKTKEE